MPHSPPPSDPRPAALPSGPPDRHGNGEAVPDERTGAVELDEACLADEPAGEAAAAPPLPVEAIDERVTVVDERSLPVKLWSWFCGVLEWFFGVFSLLVGLALLATIPVVQFLSLGYLLESSGRVSRSGRIRDGFIGVRTAARIGSLVLGTWLMLLPLRLVADIANSARLIDPHSGVTSGWRIALFILTGLMLAHILLAWYCGGKLRHFFWPLLAPLFFAMWGLRRLVASRALRPIVRPLVGTISPRLLRDLTTVPALTDWFPPAILWEGIRRGRLYFEARDAVWRFVANFHPQYYFWLGLRGFVGAMVWLFVPIMLIIATTKLGMNNPQQGAEGLGALAGLTGSLLLTVVLLYLPYLQAHFAAERRFAAFFEVGRVRAMFRRAPIAFWFALLVTLAFALPLYLLKIEFVQRELLWVLSLVFVAFVFPARLIMGWAVGRARRRERPRFFLFRWLAFFAQLPVVAFYVFVVYFTQYFSWYGAWSLFEQHAFLTPVPFLGRG